MRLPKGFLYAGLASAILFAVSAPANADNVTVLSDSGSGTATVTGTDNPGGGATFVASTALITEVTTPAMPNTVSLTLGIAFNLIGSGGTITGGTGTKIISDGTNAATLELRFIGGSYNSSGSLIIDASITHVSETGLVGGFNFTNLGPPGNGADGSSVVTVTGATDWTTVFDHTGVTATTPFGIVETAGVVPEPSTMALLGIGMTGFFAFRRFFKRHATA